jgi:predicted nucleic acid binding AN1-type Zn finger protein
MSTCDECGRQENMPYQCRHCGGTFCAEHRLPENHGCPGLDDWGEPDRVFDSGFDDSVVDEGSGF